MTEHARSFEVRRLQAVSGLIADLFSHSLCSLPCARKAQHAARQAKPKRSRAYDIFAPISLYSMGTQQKYNEGEKEL